MRYQVMICGEDQAYINKLGHYLLTQSKYDFDITYLYTITDIAIQLKKASNHILILEETIYESISVCINIPIVLLTEGITNHPNENHIFKYQPANNIAESIHNVFLEKKNSEIVLAKEKETKLTICFSPCGGSGNTTIASTIAIIKNSQRRKVLYINLELFPIINNYHTTKEIYNLSDYLVHTQTRTNWLLGLEKMISIDESTGAHFLLPRSHMKDLLDWDQENLLEVILYICKNSDYKDIIVDIDINQMYLLFGLLNMASRIIYTIRADEIGTRKWDLYKKELEQIKENESMKKSVLIYNQTNNAMKHDYQSEKYIAYDSQLVEMKGKVVKGSAFYQSLERILDEKRNIII